MPRAAMPATSFPRISSMRSWERLWVMARRSSSARAAYAASNSSLRAFAAAPTRFRYPGLCHDAHDDAIVGRLGLTIDQPTIVAGDPFTRNTAGIVRDVLRRAKDGAVTDCADTMTEFAARGIERNQKSGESTASRAWRHRLNTTKGGAAAAL